MSWFRKKKSSQSPMVHINNIARPISEADPANKNRVTVDVDDHYLPGTVSRQLGMMFGGKTYKQAHKELLATALKDARLLDNLLILDPSLGRFRETVDSHAGELVKWRHDDIDTAAQLVREQQESERRRWLVDGFAKPASDDGDASSLKADGLVWSE